MTDLERLIPGEVITRSEWGGPTTPGGARRDRDRVQAMTLHWTTGNTLGESNQARWVYNIWRFHTQTRGWADIGYAYLVDRWGNVYVGRGRYRQLAHASGYNTTHLGVAFLGGHNDHVTLEAKLALAGLYRWLPREGGMGNLRRVNGHRDLGSTACPGTRLWRFAQSGLAIPKDELPEPTPEPKPSRYDMLIYARRDTPDSLSAYNVLSQFNTFSVFTHSRGEALDALEAGDRVVAVGGPAARDMLGTDAPGGVKDKRDLTTVVGGSRQETLELFLEWGQDNL